jgi:hypothetical protein
MLRLDLLRFQSSASRSQVYATKSVQPIAAFAEAIADRQIFSGVFSPAADERR